MLTAVGTDLNMKTAEHALSRPTDNLDQAELDVLMMELERNFTMEKKMFEGAELMSRALTRPEDKAPVQEKMEESWKIMTDIRVRLAELADMRKKISRVVLVTNFGPNSASMTPQQKIESIDLQMAREAEVRISTLFA